MTVWIKLNDVRVKTGQEDQPDVYCLMALYNAPSYVLNFDEFGDLILDWED